MLKTEIVLDEEKIIREGKSDINDIWQKIDNLFTESGLIKLDKGVYRDAGNDGDWAMFGHINIQLFETPWFHDNVKRWLWYNSDNSDDENDFEVEDVIYELEKAKREIVV